MVKGEVEVVKTNLNAVFYNHATGITGMKESNQKAAMIMSNEILGDDGPAKSSDIIYTGSEFHMSVQTYLSKNIDTQISFKEKHRSKFNQQNLKEIRVANFGAGYTFGDIDVFRQRAYMYTLRSASSDVILYEVSSNDLLIHLKSSGHEREFQNWSK